MEVDSAAQILSLEEGAIQIAFDLSGSVPEYLSSPRRKPVVKRKAVSSVTTTTWK